MVIRTKQADYSNNRSVLKLFIKFWTWWVDSRCRMVVDRVFHIHVDVRPTTAATRIKITFTVKPILLRPPRKLFFFILRTRSKFKPDRQIVHLSVTRSRGLSTGPVLWQTPIRISVRPRWIYEWTKYYSRKKFKKN